MTYSSPNEAQTKSIARQLTMMLEGGEILTLSGDLGAGKTTFTKGLADGLGVSDTITSPTFSLMNVYPVTNHDQIKTLVHIDTYRLEQEDELLVIGVEDYLADPETVVIIEWPGRVKGLLEKYKTIDIWIKSKGDDERIIEVEGIE